MGRNNVKPSQAFTCTNQKGGTLGNLKNMDKRFQEQAQLGWEKQEPAGCLLSTGVQDPTRLALRGGEADVAAQEMASARKVGKMLAYRRRWHISELLRDHALLYTIHFPQYDGRATTKEIRSTANKLTQKATMREAKSIPSSPVLHPGSQFAPRGGRPWTITSVLDTESLKGEHKPDWTRVFPSLHSPPKGFFCDRKVQSKHRPAGDSRLYT